MRTTDQVVAKAVLVQFDDNALQRVSQMFYKLVHKFTEEYIHWGEENAPVDRKTIDNCLRFLYSIPQEIQMPDFSLDGGKRHINMTWITEFAELELEIGPEHFCRTINTVNGVTNWMYGEGNEIPPDLLDDLWAISAIMTDDTE